MASPSIQEIFLAELKNKLPPGISLADEITDLLNISMDSAYRRIRGTTLFTIDEIVKLSGKYNISLDLLTYNDSPFISFQHISVDNKKFTLKNLLELILRDFDDAQKNGQVELLYLARDLPIFYLLQIPEICSFKMFFWQLLYEDPHQKALKYQPGIIEQELIDQGRKIWNEFVKVPSVEIWGYPTFEALLEEIGFMWESHRIENKEIALLLCDKAKQLIEHVKEQAELGYKFSYGQQPVERTDNLRLYFTDFQLTHNKIIINGKTKRVYIPTSLDTLVTSDEKYFERNYYLFGNSTRRSTLISTTGEVSRNKFIDKCVSRVNQLRTRIELSEEV